MVVQTKRTGAWREVGALLKEGSKIMQRAVEEEVRGVAEDLRDKMIQGIREQSPGGKIFKKIKNTTQVTRYYRGFYGELALIGSNQEQLIRNITVKKEGKIIYVGVFSSKKDRGGATLKGIGEINEYGKVIKVNVTEKMRKFLHALFRHAGMLTVGKGQGDVITIKIPPRPFVDPVVKKYASPSAIKTRLRNRVDKNLRDAGYGAFLK